MTTISEDYVSFEVAKLLKEKGFDQDCATYYLDGQVWRHYHGEVIPKGKQIYAAPTQAMAMKWLREAHNIHIVLSPNKRMGNLYSNIIFTNENGELQPQPCNFFFATYEQACEAAIKYCLENLI